ncbi:MAG: TetR/AcrR family transcriptional regulator [Deltaproteobacteria bacterium]|nr:TetR/AcrR family transcriptional regulator [Deltaproteobacteria bacterium]
MNSRRRQRILECARDIYLEQGLKALSMRKIAAQVGLSPMALYRHFKDRKDLVFQLVEEGFRIFGSYLHQALEGRTPQVRLHRTGEAYLRFALEQSRYYQMIFMSPEQLGCESIPLEIQNKAYATFQFLVDRVQESMRAGILKMGEPMEVTLVLWAQSHGLVSLFLLGHFGERNDKNFQKIYRTSIQRILDGLER